MRRSRDARLRARALDVVRGFNDRGAVPDVGTLMTFRRTDLEQMCALLGIGHADGINKDELARTVNARLEWRRSIARGGSHAAA